MLAFLSRAAQDSSAVMCVKHCLRQASTCESLTIFRQAFVRIFRAQTRGWKSMKALYAAMRMSRVLSKVVMASCISLRSLLSREVFLIARITSR